MRQIHPRVRHAARFRNEEYRGAARTGVGQLVMQHSCRDGEEARRRIVGRELDGDEVGLGQLAALGLAREVLRRVCGDDVKERLARRVGEEEPAFDVAVGGEVGEAGPVARDDEHLPRSGFLASKLDLLDDLLLGGDRHRMRRRRKPANQPA